MTISFSKLANIKVAGRLGNAMFQYAFLRTTANNMGVKYSCPMWWGDAIFNLNEHNRDMSLLPAGSQLNLMNSPRGYVKHIIIDNSDILGFFQSEKFFNSREEILSWYKFKDNYSKLSDKYPDLKHRVAVHVRRGDYLRFKNVFNILGKNYYMDALSMLSTRRIALFSDDIKEARKIFQGTNICILPMNHAMEEDLFLMTKCNGVIMANSTYSWWGAYLNPNQNRIIYPLNWYVDSKGQNKDIGCKGWIGI